MQPEVVGPAHIKLHQCVPIQDTLGPQKQFHQQEEQHATEQLATTETCSAHGQQLTLFCTDCSIPLCSKCVIFDSHKEHNCATLDSAYFICADALNLKTRFAAKLVDDKQRELKLLQTRRAQLVKNVEQSMEKIAQDCSVLRRKAQEKERTALGSVHSSGDRIVMKLTAQLERTQRHIQQLAELQDTITYVCQQSSPAEFMRSFRSMSRDLNKAIEHGDEMLARHKVEYPGLCKFAVPTEDVLTAIENLSVTAEQETDLKFESDLDKNGLFFFLGTLSSTQFSSPVSSGAVRVAASSWHLNSEVHARHSAWEPNMGFVLTSNRPGSWVEFEIATGHSILPLCYRIQNANIVNHGSELNYVLRNWSLEASVDQGASWVVLRRHRNDNSLEVRPFAAASWKITPPPTETWFTRFRIVGTGHDSGGQSFVHLGSVEFWGKVRSPVPPVR